MKEAIIKMMEDSRQNLLQTLKEDSKILENDEIDQMLDSLLEIEKILKTTSGSFVQGLFLFPSAKNLSKLQQVQSKVRTTDDFMSVLGLPFEQPKASVSVGRNTDVASTKSIDRSAGVDCRRTC